MSRLTRLKLALGVGALAAFAWGLRSGDERGGWVALALLGVAFALRFAGPRPPPRRRWR